MLAWSRLTTSPESASAFACAEVPQRVNADLWIAHTGILIPWKLTWVFA